MMFCKDCKHSRGEGYKMTCESPNNFVDHIQTELYLVTGIKQPVIKATRGLSCAALRFARGELDSLTCGPLARWFEEK